MEKRPHRNKATHSPLKSRSFLILMRSIRKITRSYTILRDSVYLDCPELPGFLFLPRNNYVSVRCFRYPAMSFSFCTDYSAITLFRKMLKAGLIDDEQFASILKELAG